METTMRPNARCWSVPAAFLSGRPDSAHGTTAPHAGAYGTAASALVPAVAVMPAGAMTAGSGALALGTADAFATVAGRQVGADARTVITLDPGSPPRDCHLL